MILFAAFLTIPPAASIFLKNDVNILNNFSTFFSLMTNKFILLSSFINFSNSVNNTLAEVHLSTRSFSES